MQHKAPDNNSWRFCIAPMIDWTDKHCRYFMRLITRHTRLYTEMITTGALIYGDTDRFLSFHPAENPVALQLGGCDPKALAQCAQLAQSYGYAEVNLNVGCPSNRVQAGKFGACLMAEPHLVAECVAAMKEACALPITVKSRIGIDKADQYEFLEKFIETVAHAGCQHFIIHARKAWLNGLSPKENREIPPLCYDTVYQIKQDFPDLTIVINGGITTLEQASRQLERVDGVMLGRAAYYDPYLLREADQLFFHAEPTALTRQNIIEQMLPYIDHELTQGTRLHTMTRHLLNLWNGQPGAKNWRQNLSQISTLSAIEGMNVLQKLITTI